MAKKKQNREFEPPPELTKPIEWEGPRPPFFVQGLLELDEGCEEHKRQHEEEVSRALTLVARESERRLGILAQHLGIDLRSKTGFQHLAYTLARTLFPKGFEVDYGLSKSGREKFWNAQRLAELIADVEEIKLEKNCNDTTACSALVKRATKAGKGRYLPREGSTEQQAASTLQNRLGEARALVPTAFALMWFLWEQEAHDASVEQGRYLTNRIIEAFGSRESVRT